MSKRSNLIRSIYESQEKPIEATVKGEIPKWLQGTLFRNGPGRFKFGDKTYKHLFDGMACINKFQMKDGKVFYTNRLLETESYKKTLENNNLEAMFGTENVNTTLFNRLKTLLNLNELTEIDNVNINVLPFGKDQLYALTETSMICRIDPQTLEIINTENLTNYLKTTSSSLAHPHIDKDGSWFSVGMQITLSQGAYDFLKFELNENSKNLYENAKLLCRIPSSHNLGLSYCHSFGLSQNYIIFIEGSVVFDFKYSLKNAIILNNPHSTCFKVDKDFPAKIYLIERETGKVMPQKWFTNPIFTFHHINAYEDRNMLIIDIAAYELQDFSFDNFSYDEKLYSETDDFLIRSKAHAKRIVVPLDAKENEEVFCPIKHINDRVYLELPSINYEKFNGKFYNYTYAIGASNDSKQPITIVKINVNNYNDSIEAILKSDNDYCVPSEPIFVAHPEAKSEDDGVLLSIVLGNKYDYLSVIDATNLLEIARAELPENVKASFSFHGFFADLKSYENFNS